MSPSAASSRTNAGSFFSSPGWKRVFSSSRTSPGCSRATAALRRLADAILARTRPAARSLARQRGSDRLQRLLRIASLRPAEMREQDHLAALVGDLGDGRRDALDAGSVGDLAVLHRHVEVDAHQHALALRPSSVIERLGHARYGSSARARDYAAISLRALQAASDQLPHRHGGVDHAVREAPFVVVPGHHPHQCAVHDLGLVHVEHCGMRDRG